jgi:hypothetical protein
MPDQNRARVILHIDPRFHDRYRNAAHLAIFPLIEDIITARGGEVLVQARPPAALSFDQRWGDGDLHVYQDGPARGVGWLNTALAYLTGYWHLDPRGVLAESSAATMPFDLSSVDLGQAREFAASLHARFVQARVSRYRQAEHTADLPKGCIAVFLQGQAPAARGHQYFGTRAMLRATVAAAAGRAVLVKPHPLRKDHGREIIAELRALGHDLIETHAHVHDLLASCAVSVSMNSAAAIEGFLHEKPAILCGKSDFHSQAEVVRRPEHMAEALARATDTPRDYAPWLQWYFGQFCIDITAEDAPARILARFAQSGFDGARLGLSS